jgi:hypothetical protein
MPPMNQFAQRQADIEKEKKDKQSDGDKQSDDALGKKKLEDTSPFANDGPSAPEQANRSAENISNQMAQANGIGKASERTYDTSAGQITGGEYTNKNGTFLVANNSEGQAVKYKVETDSSTGSKTLVDQTGKGESLAVRQPAETATRTADTTASQTTERQSSTPTERQSATPPSDHQNFAPPSVAAQGDRSTASPGASSDGASLPPRGSDATKRPPASVVGQTIDASPPSPAPAKAGTGESSLGAAGGHGTPGAGADQTVLQQQQHGGQAGGAPGGGAGGDGPLPPAPTRTPVPSDGSVVTTTNTGAGAIDSSAGQPPTARPGVPGASGAGAGADSGAGKIVTTPNPNPTLASTGDAGAGIVPIKPNPNPNPLQPTGSDSSAGVAPSKPANPGAPVAPGGDNTNVQTHKPNAPVATDGSAPTSPPQRGFNPGGDGSLVPPAPVASDGGPARNLNPGQGQQGDLGGLRQNPQGGPQGLDSGTLGRGAQVPPGGDTGVTGVMKPPLATDGSAAVPGQMGQVGDGAGKLTPIVPPADSSIGRAPAQPVEANLGRIGVPTSGDTTIAGATGAGLDKLRPTIPTDVANVGVTATSLAPNLAQTLALKQAGLDINNPSDVALLTSAKAQLQAAKLTEGTAQLSLANVLSTVNVADANKLAAFLTGKPDALASQVALSDANIGKLNALFKTEAPSLAAIPTTLDAQKTALGKGMADFMALANPATLTQRDIYTEVNKLTANLQPNDAAQRLGMAELLGRTLVPLLKPAESQVAAPVATTKVEATILKPENPAALNTALAEARARADIIELTPKTLPTVTRTDMVENTATALANTAAGKALVQPTATDQTRIADAGRAAEQGIRPNATTNAEGIANPRVPADETGRVNRSPEETNETAERGTASSARSDMVDINDKRSDAKKKQEGKEHSEQQQHGGGGGFGIDASILTGAAMRVVDRDQDKLDATKKKDDDEKKAPRRRYVVRFNDTLQSIAQKSFRDVRVAVLIAAINSEVIPEDMPLDEPLKAGMQIWLPSESEVAEFYENVNDYIAQREQLSPEEELARRFGNGWEGNQNPSLAPPVAKPISRPWPQPRPSGDSQATTGPNTELSEGLMDAAIAAAAKRRENVESVLGPLSKPQDKLLEYTVRLGDSLKSIATKHPALQDVVLWELLASVNKIAVPSRDPSAVKLNRGSKLLMPTPEQIAAFREGKAENQPEKKPVSGGNPTVITSNLRTTPSKPITAPPSPFVSGPTTGGFDDHGSTRFTAPVTDAGASMLRAGGFVKTEQQRASEDAETVLTAAIQPSKPITTDKPQVENVKQLADDCRIVRRHLVDQNGRIYQAQLEVRRGTEWVSVMMYNISEGNCWRKCINEQGITEILPLELPTPAIHQMLENDFSNNWEEHRDRFLNQPV